MSDVLGIAELDGQQVELLPARTVLSTFTQGLTGGKGTDGTGSIGTSALFGGLLQGNGYGTNGADANGTSAG